MVSAVFDGTAVTTARCTPATPVAASSAAPVISPTLAPPTGATLPIRSGLNPAVVLSPLTSPAADGKRRFATGRSAQRGSPVTKICDAPPNPRRPRSEVPRTPATPRCPGVCGSSACSSPAPGRYPVFHKDADGRFCKPPYLRRIYTVLDPTFPPPWSAVSPTSGALQLGAGRLVSLFPPGAATPTGASCGRLRHSW